LKIKIISHDIKEKRFKIKIESNEDLWYFYHFVRVGDKLSGSTERKIRKEEHQSAKKKVVFMEIEAEKKEFRPDRVRVLGKIIGSSEEIGKGYHSFNVDQKTTIIVTKEEYTEFEKRLLKQSQQKREAILLGAIDYGELDLGILKEKVEYLGTFRKNLPPKSNPDYEKIRDNFLKQAVKEINETLKRKKIKKAVIGYVGFLGEELEGMLPENVFVNKVSTTGKVGLNEVVKRGYVQKIISDEVLSKESDAVEELLKQISSEGKYAYGIKEVTQASELGAIETFLITDKFMQENIEDFKKIDIIMRSVEKNKGKIMILKSSNEPGEKLDGLGGIGSLLRYRIS